jgi:hypothetical protein
VAAFSSPVSESTHLCLRFSRSCYVPSPSQLDIARSCIQFRRYDIAGRCSSSSDVTLASHIQPCPVSFLFFLSWLARFRQESLKQGRDRLSLAKVTVTLLSSPVLLCNGVTEEQRVFRRHYNTTVSGGQLTDYSSPSIFMSLYTSGAGGGRASPIGYLSALSRQRMDLGPPPLLASKIKQHG